MSVIKFFLKSFFFPDAFSEPANSDAGAENIEGKVTYIYLF